MGRRRGGYSHCIPRRWKADQYPFADDPTRGMVETWCGESRSHDRAEAFEAPKLASCLKCAQAIGKHKLARSPRLRIERREEPLGYDKSTYDVFIDGTLRAHVGIANGWGEKWYLAKVGDIEEAKRIGYRTGRHGGQVSGSVVDYFTAKGRRFVTEEREKAEVFWPVHFNSRDAMACAALVYWERHGIAGLPTLEEARQAEADRKAQQALDNAAREEAREAARVERERREALHLERIETARLGLAAWQARGDLSNVELAAIDAMREAFLELRDD